jgi:hypothetical protein
MLEKLAISASASGVAGGVGVGLASSSARRADLESSNAAAKSKRRGLLMQCYGETV